MSARTIAGLVARTFAICVGVLGFAAAGRGLSSPATSPDHHCPGGNFYCDIECSGIWVEVCNNNDCRMQCTGGERVVHKVWYPSGGGGGGGGGGDGGGPNDGKSCLDACWWDSNDLYGCLDDCWGGEN